MSLGPWTKDDDDSFSERSWISRLAKLFDCRPHEIANSFQGLPNPELSSRDELSMQRRDAKSLEQASALAAKLADQLSELSPTAVSIHQMQSDLWIDQAKLFAFSSALKMSGEETNALAGRFGERGRTNIDAHAVAEGVARLFEHLGKPIGFSHAGGKPAGPYGRAVFDAFKELKIKADWREPAHRAWKARS